jgi:hypothetical protein
MNKAIIGLFAALALAGCATTPSTTSRSAAKPAAKPAAPAETGIQGKQAWNGLIVVVPRGIFSCDAAVRKVARTYKLFQETREYNNDGNGFSYEYSDTYDTPYVIQIKGSNEKTELRVRAGHVWENNKKRSAKLMQVILDELSTAKPVVGEEKGGDSYQSGI